MSGLVTNLKRTFLKMNEEGDVKNVDWKGKDDKKVRMNELNTTESQSLNTGSESGI